MDANRKKIVVVGAAAVVALVLILIVVLFFLGGEPEPKPVVVKPQTPAAGKTDETKPAETAEPAKKTEATATAPAGSYAVKKGATLEDIAARPEVYGNAANWWALWQANPDAVSYAFEHDGKWVAIARAGASLKVAPGKALSDADKAALTSKVSPHAVQFGSFPDAGEAQALLAKLSSDKSMDFYITQRVIDGVQYNRVRAGFFKSFTAADKFGEATVGKGSADDYLAVEPLAEELRAQNAAIYKKYKGGE